MYEQLFEKASFLDVRWRVVHAEEEKERAREAKTERREREKQRGEREERVEASKESGRTDGAEQGCNRASSPMSSLWAVENEEIRELDRGLHDERLSKRSPPPLSLALLLEKRVDRSALQ